VTVIEDACRAIDVDGSLAATRENFARLDIGMLRADAIA
jgi:nicotinamidase-related amidase